MAAVLDRFYGTGRRKTSVARVWIKPGSGRIVVNRRAFEDYFPRETLRMIIAQPLQITNTFGQFDVLVTVAGGGPTGQGVRCDTVARELTLRQKLRSPLRMRSCSRAIHAFVPARIRPPGARQKFQYSRGNRALIRVGRRAVAMERGSAAHVHRIPATRHSDRLPLAPRQPIRTCACCRPRFHEPIRAGWRSRRVVSSRPDLARARGAVLRGAARGIDLPRLPLRNATTTWMVQAAHPTPTARAVRVRAAGAHRNHLGARSWHRRALPVGAILATSPSHFFLARLYGSYRVVSSRCERGGRAEPQTDPLLSNGIPDNFRYGSSPSPHAGWSTTVAPRREACASRSAASGPLTAAFTTASAARDAPGTADLGQVYREFSRRAFVAARRGQGHPVVIRPRIL